MFSEFLNGLSCVLPDERADFMEVREALRGGLYVSFMPAIVEDMWPLHALECTAVHRFGPQDGQKHVCIIPMGAHDFWSGPSVKRLIEDFYERDELPDGPLSYGAELEEMLLLTSKDVSASVQISGAGAVQVIFAKITMQNGRQVYLFALPDEAHDAWRNIFERYGIPCDMLIDSHKGLGDWLEDVPLYASMKETARPELLPRFYFKGKYVSHGAPEGCSSVYQVSESGPHECLSEIFETGWRERFGRQ